MGTGASQGPRNRFWPWEPFAHVCTRVFVPVSACAREPASEHALEPHGRMLELMRARSFPVSVSFRRGPIKCDSSRNHTRVDTWSHLLQGGSVYQGLGLNGSDWLDQRPTTSLVEITPIMSTKGSRGRTSAGIWQSLKTVTRYTHKASRAAWYRAQAALLYPWLSARLTP